MPDVYFPRDLDDPASVARYALAAGDVAAAERASRDALRSVLSSAMMMGLVEPDDELVAASIAADHTGQPNAIADLLQALAEGREGDRTDEQYLESLRNLRLLREGKPLESCAKRAFDLRLGRRVAAGRLVDEGRFTLLGGVAWAILDEEVDGSFFPTLLPDAAFIMLAIRHRPHPITV